MRLVHFYDAATGIFTGASFSFPNGRDDVLRANTPAGCRAFDGPADHLSQRVDVETSELVNYVPPQSDADHEWNPERKRWQKRADVVAREVEHAATRQRIAELETKQLRVIREDRLRPNERGQNGKSAHDRLQEIDDEIATLRAQLSAETDTSARRG